MQPERRRMGVTVSHRTSLRGIVAVPKIGTVAAGLFLFFSLMGGISAAGGAPQPGSSWFVDMNRAARSAHAALSCEQCHGSMAEQGKIHPDLKEANALKREATRSYDYGLCRNCHRLAYDRYRMGAHAKALQEELTGKGKAPGEKPKKAPVCGDCHSAHYGPAGLSRSETGRRMTSVCGSCHQPQMKSYLNDFHGRTAVDLGDETSAYCTDCHGAHTAVSLKEKAQALRACSRCHPKAEAQFTTFVIHASVDNLADKDPEKRQAVLLIHRVKVIATIVVGLLLFFFLGHTFLWVLREVHEKLRKR